MSRASKPNPATARGGGRIVTSPSPTMTVVSPRLSNFARSFGLRAFGLTRSRTILPGAASTIRTSLNRHGNTSHRTLGGFRSRGGRNDEA